MFPKTPRTLQIEPATDGRLAFSFFAAVSTTNNAIRQPLLRMHFRNKVTLREKNNMEGLVKIDKIHPFGRKQRSDVQLVRAQSPGAL